MSCSESAPDRSAPALSRQGHDDDDDDDGDMYDLGQNAGTYDEEEPPALESHGGNGYLTVDS